LKCSGVGRFEGSGGPSEFVITPNSSPCMKKILTALLHFAWTPLGRSGWSGPLDPPASYATVCYTINIK